MKKLIITAALTGGITLPTQTPYLPITPMQIAQEAYQACQAGASIVHVHARDPITGKPTADLNIFQQILTNIKKKSNVVICITTGGALGMPVEKRVRVVPVFKPEMASFNMGSMNFSIHPILNRIKVFKYDWEETYARTSKGAIFPNTFQDLEYLAKIMVENQVKPELEVYDAGQLYNVAFLLRTGLLQSPVHIQFVMGVLGGIGKAPEDLLYLKNTADRLIGSEKYTWSVIGVGAAQFYLGTLAAIMGGNVRVGLEDNIYLERGVLSKSNAELVAKMVRIAKELGLDVADPDEARKILALKGIYKVNF
ncbi:MAG: 3-keto-5-aminohexanoate cleavage protein [Candidatus Bathyarchaeota archaeon]|nr:MAG: 3-keto-5-aminohexanoate cleavage protein [Candidatus Bathyarchaeota archaeon]